MRIHTVANYFRRKAIRVHHEGVPRLCTQKLKTSLIKSEKKNYSDLKVKLGVAEPPVTLRRLSFQVDTMRT